MIEHRIDQWRWQEMDANLRADIRSIIRHHAADVGYDHTFDYYWAKFTEQGWLLANIEDSTAADNLKQWHAPQQ